MTRTAPRTSFLHRYAQAFWRNFGKLDSLLISALTPALCLAAYIGFGRQGLLVTAIVVPVLLVAYAVTRRDFGKSQDARDPVTGLEFRSAAVALLDRENKGKNTGDRSVATVAIGFEEMDRLKARFGEEATQKVLVAAAGRIEAAIREWDIAVRLDQYKFAVALTRLRRVDLEMMIEIGSRLQRDLSEPYQVDGTKTFVTTSVGVCLPPVAPSPSGDGLMTGAERALDEAMAVTGGAIRRYTDDMRRRDQVTFDLGSRAHDALADGRILPWFQPQVSTDTGKITGIEALARWDDTSGGMISPGQFLPTIESEGLTELLGEVILERSLAALKHWDHAGLHVPSVAVNASDAELRNPKYCDRVRWELDRAEIEPARLTIEVLETVTSDGADDVVARNLWSLARLGCRIDMDDFGTGNASLSSLRRFAVHRLKIDRSYVTDLDKDVDQQSMVAAIVTMAERLDLETLAEGIETEGEHAMAAQLGCLHVQGYSVARPMPLDTCTTWLANYEANYGAETLPDLASNVSSKTQARRNGKTA
ncbi:MAG: bifunctional diguanylate cyclase/phosphodiesterase [Pseudomonadota bacterium]